MMKMTKNSGMTSMICRWVLSIVGLDISRLEPSWVPT